MHDDQEAARRAVVAADRAADVNAGARPVDIDGHVVRRPASATTGTVHSLLRHLRARGVHEVAEPIAIDGEVESLGFIAGESGGDGWRHQHTDAGLASAARLLRRIHDAGRDWSPPPEACWGAPEVAGDDIVYCHGDPGPWNYVWRDQEAVGLIDWDYLHPAPRLDDVAYALRWFTPFRSDALADEWHHFPEPPDRKHRIPVFLEAYGDLPEFDVVDAVTSRMQATIDHCRALAAAGVEPQRTWVAEGFLSQDEQEIAWIRDRRELFSTR